MSLKHLIALCVPFSLLVPTLGLAKTPVAKTPPAKAPKATITATYQANDEQCKMAAGFMGDLDAQADDTLAHGDKANALAQTFASSSKISDDDSTLMFDETNKSSDGIEKMMNSIKSIDNLFPSGTEVSLQLLHLKIGLAMDPIKPYATRQVSRMMSTINCDLGSGFGLCQAKQILPLYVSTHLDGTPAQPFSDFRKAVSDQISTLKNFFTSTLCKQGFDIPVRAAQTAPAPGPVPAPAPAPVAQSAPAPTPVAAVPVQPEVIAPSEAPVAHPDPAPAATSAAIVLTAPAAPVAPAPVAPTPVAEQAPAAVIVPVAAPPAPVAPVAVPATTTPVVEVAPVPTPAAPAAPTAPVAPTPVADQAPAPVTVPVAPTPAPVSSDCKTVTGLLADLDAAAADTLAHGDKANTLAAAFGSTGTLSDDDSQTMFNETDKCSDGITKMMSTIKSIDALFPAGTDIKLQMTHLKSGLAMEQLQSFDKKQINLMMTSTIECSMDDGKCQAQKIESLYSSTAADGTTVKPYADFRKSVQEQVANLKSYFASELCKPSDEVAAKPADQTPAVETVADPKAAPQSPAPAQDVAAAAPNTTGQTTAQ